MSPFRDALDLGHIVTKYEDHLANAAVNYVDGKIARQAETEPIPERLYQRSRPLGTSPDPELMGAGPKTASTCLAAAPARPTFAWDPNRYYRDLGIPWPYVGATRKDLRLAFFEAGGPDSRRLTYCLKQLLNSEVRAEYDAMPLGKQYLNDDYVQDAFKAKVASEASKRSAEGIYTTPEEVLDEWGYYLQEDAEDSKDSGAETLDSDHLNRQDDPAADGDWQYGFYLWRTTSWDAKRLSQWQAALISELSGTVPTLVVGMMGKQPHRFVVAEVDGGPVVFLNRDEEVTPDLAKAAAQSLQRNQ